MSIFKYITLKKIVRDFLLKVVLYERKILLQLLFLDSAP